MRCAIIQTLLYKYMYSQSHVVYGNAPTVPAGIALPEQQERLFAVPGQLSKTLQLG